MSELVKSIQTPDGIIRDSLKSICTDATAHQIAKLIVETMEREADDEQLDFDFHISGSTGKMAVSAAYAERNVWFKFDVKPKTILAKVKKEFFKQDCNSVELEFIDEFNRKICSTLLDNYASDIESVLRAKMFGGKDVPVKLVAAVMFEMIDFGSVRPEENYQMVIAKHVPKGQIDNTNAVSEELFRIHMETGKGFNQIVREKKAAGDPNYRYVTGVETKKMLWEAQIDMFVDFSATTGLGQPTATQPE